MVVTQCEAGVQAIANSLGLSGDDWMLCYQSRVGREPWLQPYTDKTLETLGEEGLRKVQVVCPGFAVCWPPCREGCQMSQSTWGHTLDRKGQRTLLYILPYSKRILSHNIDLFIRLNKDHYIHSNKLSYLYDILQNIQVYDACIATHRDGRPYGGDFLEIHLQHFIKVLCGCCLVVHSAGSCCSWCGWMDGWMDGWWFFGMFF